ncbi:hypothetical protein ACET52_01095 [Aeromonas veronii]
MFRTISIKSPAEISTSQSEPLVYKIPISDSLSLSILAKLNPNQDFLLVLYNGAIAGHYKNKPKFSRWSWADEANYSFICIDDPVVSEIGDTNLAWYIGTNEIDLQSKILSIIKSITKSLNIENNRVIFYGSSGGGFASLMSATLLKGSACIVSNPQTNILNYHKSSVEKYIKSAFGEIESNVYDKFKDRLSVMSRMTSENYLPTVYYKQNIIDKSHFNKHLKPFQSKYYEMLSETITYPNKLFLEIISHKDGHSAISTRMQFRNEIEFLRSHLEEKNKNDTCAYTILPNEITLKNHIIWVKKLNPEVNKVIIKGNLVSNSIKNPALIAIKTSDNNYTRMETIGFKYSKGLKCAFKYISQSRSNQIDITISTKNMNISEIGLMNWKSEPESKIDNLKIETNYE